MADEIIGRREELLALEAFLEAVPAGGQALLLEGDAGIGKTALWHEALALARDATSACCGAPDPVGGAGRLRGPRRSVAPALERRAAAAAAGSTARSRDRVADPRAGRAAAGGAALGLALLSVVACRWPRSRSCSRLDDAQWLDASSAEVLTFMLRRLERRAGRCSRDGARAAGRGAARARPRLRRASGGFRSSRSPWERSIGCSGAGFAIEPAAAGARARARDHRRATRSSRSSSGARSSRARSARTSADVELPESLRAVVAQRLGALPAHVRETLVAVAALAAPSMPCSSALGGTTRRRHRARRSRRGVVELDGDRIRFTHPLLAPACYEAMPLHRRRRLHRRLAELDVDLEERARHLAIAATGPDEKVAAALDAAAAHASARGAAQAAADLSERASR